MPTQKAIDMTEFDAVQVKWEGSSSSRQMKGTLIISKAAIRSKDFIEWIENREMYEIWEAQNKANKKAL